MAVSLWKQRKQQQLHKPKFISTTVSYCNFFRNFNTHLYRKALQGFVTSIRKYITCYKIILKRLVECFMSFLKIESRDCKKILTKLNQSFNVALKKTLKFNSLIE